MCTAVVRVGDYEKAVTWLEKCAENSDDLLPTFIRSPIYDSLNGIRGS
jgi:hypothetical protein